MPPSRRLKNVTIQKVNFDEFGEIVGNPEDNTSMIPGKAGVKVWYADQVAAERAAAAARLAQQKAQMEADCRLAETAVRAGPRRFSILH